MKKLTFLLILTLSSGFSFANNIKEIQLNERELIVRNYNQVQIKPLITILNDFKKWCIGFTKSGCEADLVSSYIEINGTRIIYEITMEGLDDLTAIYVFSSTDTGILTPISKSINSHWKKVFTIKRD